MSELMDEAVIRMPFDMAMESELSRKQFYDRANSALSDLIELRAYKEAAEKQEPIGYSTGHTIFQTAELAAQYAAFYDETDDVFAVYAKPVLAYKPEVAVSDGWNIVTNENWNIPRVGQRVILFSDGVVQEESYTLDQSDGEPGCGYYFWNRDDLDKCPEVKAGDMWISWPDAAAPSHSQQSAPEPSKPLPYWPTCNPGCDPEFNGERSAWCADHCKPARDAMNADRCPSHESEQGGDL